MGYFLILKWAREKKEVAFLQLLTEPALHTCLCIKPHHPRPLTNNLNRLPILQCILTSPSIYVGPPTLKIQTIPLNFDVAGAFAPDVNLPCPFPRILDIQHATHRAFMHCCQILERGALHGRLDNDVAQARLGAGLDPRDVVGDG